MVISGNVYNRLSSSTVTKKRKTTHKSSELKDLYNKMADYNKKSPLFLLDVDESKQSYMIDIKEAALTLKDATDAFADVTSDVHSKKSFYSEDESVISGTIKTNDFGDLPDELDISVDKLATQQVNVGNYLTASGLSFMPGKYSFTMNTATGMNNFSVDVTEDDNNRRVQQKIADAINLSENGVNASLVNEGNNNALMITSADYGNPGTDDGLQFSFSSESASGERLIDVMGLDDVETMPENSLFTLNGQQHSSATNQISINHAIELDFHSTSDEAIAIKLVPDSNIAKEQVDSFVDAYNSLVDLSNSEGSTNVGTRSLANDISSIVGKHKSEFEQAGLMFDENGKIYKDDETYEKSVESGEFNKIFSSISSIKKDVNTTANRLSLDPLAYVNKLIVTYPNTNGSKFDTPYTQSLYSGLMYNNYA